MPSVPAWLSALPLLAAAGRQQDDDARSNAALAAAAAALEADTDRDDSRSRLCFFLAELAAQFGRRTGDSARPIPVTRLQLARATGISLPRVKRIIGYLVLSEIVAIDKTGIAVRDWARLCSLGQFDRSWSAMHAAADEEATHARPAEELQPAYTLAGDPACFA